MFNLVGMFDERVRHGLRATCGRGAMTIFSVWREKSSVTLKPQHIPHSVAAFRLPCRPQGRTHGTARKNAAIVGAVADRDLFKF